MLLHAVATVLRLALLIFALAPPYPCPKPSHILPMMSYDISLRVDILLRFSKFLSPSLEKGRGEAPWSCQCRWWRPFVSQRQGASKHVQSQRGNIGWVNTLNYIIHITTYSLSPYLNISQPFSCFPPQHAGLGRIHVDAQEVKRILLVGFQRGRCFPAKFTVNISPQAKPSKNIQNHHDHPWSTMSGTVFFLLLFCEVETLFSAL